MRHIMESLFSFFYEVCHIVWYITIIIHTVHPLLFLVMVCYWPFLPIFFKGRSLLMYKWNDPEKYWRKTRFAKSDDITTTEKAPQSGEHTLWHDGVIKWKHYTLYWPFVWGFHRLPADSPHKGQGRGTLNIFFDLRLNKRLSRQSKSRWFETPLRLLWRHCTNEIGWIIYF